MPLRKKFKNARMNTAGKSFKEKLSYYWYYYKWHTVIFLLLFFAAFNIIYTNITAKDCILEGIFLNTSAPYTDTQQLEEEFFMQHSFDNQKEELIFDTSLGYSTDSQSVDSASYETVQLLMAKIAAGEIDFLIDSNFLIYDLAYKQYFIDLTTILSEEQVKKYEPYFLYIDHAFLIELKNNSYSDDEIIYPNATKPELMEEPIPVLIDASSIEKLTEFYPLSSSTPLLGVIANGPNIETTIAFIDYLFQ